ADFERAAAGGVVRQLLGYAPVEVAHAGVADDERGGRSASRLQQHFQLNIKVVRARALHVAGAPVIKQEQAKNMVFGLGDGYRLAQRRGPAYYEGRFQLKIELLGGAKDRLRLARWQVLAVGPPDVGAAHHDGAGPAVVGHRQAR
nr:hypothetical protein [Tanacetum cinerariifolium]